MNWHKIAATLYGLSAVGVYADHIAGTGVLAAAGPVGIACAIAVPTLIHTLVAIGQALGGDKPE